MNLIETVSLGVSIFAVIGSAGVLPLAVHRGSSGAVAFGVLGLLAGSLGFAWSIAALGYC